METRREKDSLGFEDIDKCALYGIQTMRAINNFQIVDDRVDIQFIKSLAKVKRACAMANGDVACLPQDKVDYIIKACLEIENGDHNQWFITSALQGGAGTSINMNMNEVIANRSAQLRGLAMGEYSWIHPNDDVNHGQSTNDVIPTAGKITTSLMLLDLLEHLEQLSGSFEALAQKGKDVIKVGRTHLQDAVLISMEQVFHSFASIIKRNIVRLRNVRSELDFINLGATAIGTEINTKPGYRELAVKHLSNISGLNLESVEDLVDGTKSVDSFAFVHACLKNLAMDLSKISNDMRLVASGPTAGFNEIILPAVQPGSSIMPGKVNPVILEVVNQSCFQVVGHDATITFAHEAGQMELNVFEPVIFYNLFKSFRILSNAVDVFRTKALDGLEFNRESCERSVEKSLAMATAFVDHLGYDKTSEITKRALNERRSLKDVILTENLLDEEVVDSILEPNKMIRGY